jgi:hypothetical protein
MGFGPFEIEYSRFILVAVRMRRTLYLVIFAVLVAAMAAGAFYYRHRTAAPRRQTAAGCAARACWPKPADPKLPDFGGRGPAAPGAATKPAAPVKK